MPLSPHAKGTIICAVGVMALTPDAMLIRLVVRRAEHVDDYTLLFWRMIFFASAMLVFHLLRFRSRALQVFVGVRWRDAFLASLLFGISGGAFSLSIVNTAAANTLVLVASNAIWCTLFSWAILKERPSLRLTITMIVGIGSIVLVFASGFKSGGVVGDVLGIASAISSALYFTFLRYVGGHAERVPLPAEAVMGVGSIFVALFALIFSPKFLQPRGTEWVYLFVQGMFVEGLAFFCLSIGPMLIPSAEVALIMLLETALGPLWVWLALGEKPSLFTFIGGGLLIGTLCVNSAVAIHQDHAQQRKIASETALSTDCNATRDHPARLSSPDSPNARGNPTDTELDDMQTPLIIS